MNTLSQTTTVRISRHFDVAAQDVFDAWLNPKTAGQWLFATPTGQMVRVEIDARVGGSFVFVDRRDGEDIEHVGEYLKLDRPYRLEFSFSVPKYSKERTKVVIDIVATQSGCELSLTHEGVWLDYASRTQEGWKKILLGLAETLSSTPGFAIREFSYPD